ncbi:LLM class flavin-dependent oxidoreductase [Glaciibacter sp. 2TAF33]|uniref:LLM class flavin-dependent oxidoreductase n=1 Tax=Glaciibacter sp. 2TAF33 TaxID=3233015 RepID=UPI003F933560
MQFGTFITPAGASPEATVSLALLSEELGFDLVTFQDHPYQPRFLDTWTLLAWVAARTQRVQLAPNVLNLPLRPPAVVARAAASLDLLSHGRVNLALGAGAFWDAIAAMGGRRLSPGQAVDALGEAIEVIRSVWNVEDTAVLRAGGEYYRVDGAKRGPAPAHPIPIWIGALKPRMLRLTGRAADGWLPSIGRMQPGEFQASNRVIDAAARDAGRDPAEIRRLVNVGGRFQATTGGFLVGPPGHWLDGLLPLVLDDGVGTIILASDDPDTLRRFADEVAPALRDAVAGR